MIRLDDITSAVAIAANTAASTTGYQTKLSPFCPANPLSLFAAKEGQFFLHDGTD
jgi:hypothetical protein